MRFLAFPIAVILIVLAGWAHGDLSGRWGASQELQQAVDRLQGIDQTIGSWQAYDFELDPQAVQIGEIAGYVVRRYANAAGQTYTVMLVCGRPGPIAAHTPEWCYGGAGFHAESANLTEQLELGANQTANFWRNLFVKEQAAVPERLEICWAWNAGDGWQAPENPRLAYAPQRHLYKLYVVRDASADEDGSEQASQRMEFMKELIPVVDAALFDQEKS
ncbi:exosortase-associated EpsI family protein [Tautonia rosea]|uniref:exosortase-associated EpsI family protein n=1 Tax=Tautonia rosea TaxID=2728037 RepID=UPI001472C8B6|nr:exosortase-associated EpsI family protein [Tautonia rosea]